jgi:signal transduction histidine kinase
MRECLRRAAQGMHRFGALTYESLDKVDVGKVATELVQILREDVPAALSVEVRGECLAYLTRPTLVCVVGALLAHAVEAIRDEKGRDRGVHLRVRGEDAAVVIEVEHTGDGVPSDLRPNVFQPYFNRRKNAPSPTGLQGIRERARRWGGEFSIVSARGMTTLRLVVPKLDRVRGPIEVPHSVPRLRFEDHDD